MIIPERDRCIGHVSLQGSLRMSYLQLSLCLNYSPLIPSEKQTQKFITISHHFP